MGVKIVICILCFGMPIFDTQQDTVKTFYFKIECDSICDTIIT